LIVNIFEVARKDIHVDVLGHSEAPGQVISIGLTEGKEPRLDRGTGNVRIDDFTKKIQQWRSELLPPLAPDRVCQMRCREAENGRRTVPTSHHDFTCVPAFIMNTRAKFTEPRRRHHGSVHDGLESLNFFAGIGNALKEDDRVPSSTAPTPMKVRLTQIDGALPNLALMKLSHFHRSRGDEVHFTRSVDRDLFDPAYDRVYGSVLFDFSGDRLERLDSPDQGDPRGRISREHHPRHQYPTRQ
jgi:hypothetical protein